MAAIWRLQHPHAMTTYSASIVPWSVTTALMRPSSTVRSLTSTLAKDCSAPISMAFSRMSVPARRESHTPTPLV